MTMGKDFKLLFIFTIFIVMTVVTLAAVVKVSLEANQFTSQCNDHWLNQIELVCPVYNDKYWGYEWEKFNSTPPFLIEKINEELVPYAPSSLVED